MTGEIHPMVMLRLTPISRRIYARRRYEVLIINKALAQEDIILSLAGSCCTREDSSETKRKMSYNNILKVPLTL